MDIIIRLADTGIDLEGMTADGVTEQTRKDLFDAMHSEYQDEAADPGAYLYENFDEDHFLFGAVEPEKLIARARGWNREIRDEFLRLVDAVCKVSANGALPDAEDLEMDTHETYLLQQAARELDNSWHDNSNHAVYMDNSMGFPYFTVVLSDGALKDICEHPQDYAILIVCPKS